MLATADLGPVSLATPRMRSLSGSQAREYSAKEALSTCSH